jgi:putative component of membrane protein insertase Oxa1/YidC/SpoIIIJ protein YidD
VTPFLVNFQFSLWRIHRDEIGKAQERREMNRLPLICLTFFVVLFGCSHAPSSEKEKRSSFNPMLSLVKFYRGPLGSLSAVKTGECPMHPSCSEYSAQALEKHGVFVGWMMTCDRLMRCGRSEMKLAPTIYVDGKAKYYDPVEKNDFWWNKAKLEQHPYLQDQNPTPISCGSPPHQLLHHSVRIPEG